MPDEWIQKLIDNPNNVIEIIKTLNSYFKDVYFDIKSEKLEKAGITGVPYDEIATHDAISYYTSNECNSYATILCELFGQYAIKYNSDSHIITKIGKHFYDASGIYFLTNKFHPTLEEDLYYIDTNFGREDYQLIKAIEDKLIVIGKQILASYKNKTKVKTQSYQKKSNVKF